MIKNFLVSTVAIASVLTICQPSLARFVDLGKTNEGDTILIETNHFEPIPGQSGYVYFDYFVRDGQTQQIRWNKAATPFCAYGVLSTDPVVEKTPLKKVGWLGLNGLGYTKQVTAESKTAIALLNIVCQSSYENAGSFVANELP